MAIRNLFLLALAFVACAAAEETDFVLGNDTANIIGGGLANTTAYPFHATTNAPVQCGSSLIWSDVLLTAAHCLRAFNSTAYSAYIGGITNFGRTAPEVIPIKSWLVHPQYRKTSAAFDADLMLVFLTKASAAPVATFNFDSAVPVVGQQLSVIGFGRTMDATSSPSQLLKEAKEKVIDDASCVQFFAPLIVTPANTFCTTNVTGFSCQGDSGGPIMDTVTRRIIGVTSFGGKNEVVNGQVVNFCTKGPSGYTRISTYSDWIFDMVCLYSAIKPTNCPAAPMQPIAAVTKAPVVSPLMAPPIPAPPIAVPTQPVPTPTIAAPVPVQLVPVVAPIPVSQPVPTPIAVPVTQPVFTPIAPAVPTPIVQPPVPVAPIAPPVAPVVPIPVALPTVAVPTPTPPVQLDPTAPNTVPVAPPVAPVVPTPVALPSTPLGTACPLCPGSTTQYAVKKRGFLGGCRSRCVSNPARLFRRRWKCGLC